MVNSQYRVYIHMAGTGMNDRYTVEVEEYDKCSREDGTQLYETGVEVAIQKVIKRVACETGKGITKDDIMSVDVLRKDIWEEVYKNDSL